MESLRDAYPKIIEAYGGNEFAEKVFEKMSEVEEMSYNYFKEKVKSIQKAMNEGKTLLSSLGTTFA